MNTIDLDLVHRTLTGSNPDIPFVVDAIDARVAFRDAVTGLIIDPGITLDEFHLLAEHTHDPRTRDLTCRIVRTALEHPEKLDMKRIARIAADIETEAGRRRDPQAHATTAYLYWLTGDDMKAARNAITALSIDEDTSLASLVMDAIGNRTRNHVRH